MKQTKKEAITSFLAASYIIEFNRIVGRLQYRLTSEDESDLREVDKDIVEQWRTDLRNNGIKATRNEIYAAYNDDVFDKETDKDLRDLEMYLSSVYESRVNEIKQKAEFRNVGESEWRALTKYDVNSINRQVKNYGLKSSTALLNELFYSDFSEKVNPVRDYFETLPTNDGTNYIRMLAETIKVKNDSHWEEYLTRWLVAVVANVYNEDPTRCANHTMLVLTGGQGKGKTTWLNSLIPKALKLYGYCGKINPEDKDALTLLAECMIINVDDQLRQINKKDEDAIKDLITRPKVTYRRPYDTYVQDYQRIASFCGSVNNNDFLTDPTGSRRFLPFEVIDIDYNNNIDINRVWRQAYDLYQSGYRYYFNSEEIEQLNQENQEFAMVSKEEQLLLKYFMVPDDEHPSNYEEQPAIIQNYLEYMAGCRLSSRILGLAMSKLGYVKKRKLINGKQMNLYCMYKKYIGEE